MSDRTLVRLVRATVAVGGLLAVIGSAALIAVTDVGSWWSAGRPFVALFTVFFAVFGWLVISRQPRNPVVWTMALSAFFGGIFVAGAAGAVLFVINDPSLALGEVVVPAELPRLSAWILVFADPAGFLAVFWLFFGLLLFPDGKLLSSSWRWAAVLSAAGILLATVTSAWSYRPTNVAVANEHPLITAGLLAATVGVILVMAALVVRFKRSSGATRQQFKWIMWGASIFVAAIVASLIFRDTQYEDLIDGPVMVGAVIFLGSYSIAVGRYRLFDIDLVIRRTVVYGVLVSFLAALYIAAVITLRALLPGGSDLAVAASTLAVAGLFNPLRKRIQRSVDRRFYRSRYDAQQIVEAFTSRMRNQTDIDRLTADVLQTVNQAVQPSSASIWIRATNQPQPTRTGSP